MALQVWGNTSLPRGRRERRHSARMGLSSLKIITDAMSGMHVDDELHDPPIFVACGADDLDEVIRLVDESEHGIYLLTLRYDADGTPALMSAVRHCSFRVLEYVEREAPQMLGMIDGSNHTAAHYIAWSRDPRAPEVVALLVRALGTHACRDLFFHVRTDQIPHYSAYDMAEGKPLADAFLRVVETPLVCTTCEGAPDVGRCLRHWPTDVCDASRQVCCLRSQGLRPGRVTCHECNVWCCWSYDTAIADAFDLCCPRCGEHFDCHDVHMDMEIFMHYLVQDANKQPNAIWAMANGVPCDGPIDVEYWCAEGYDLRSLDRDWLHAVWKRRGWIQNTAQAYLNELVRP